MHNPKLSILIVFLLALIFIVSSAFHDIKISPAYPRDGYATITSLSASDYSLLCSNQIAAAENILVTRLSSARKVKSSVYPVSSEVRNSEESLRKLNEIKDIMTVTVPALTYESDRSNILLLMEESIDCLTDYKTALENTDTAAINASVERMESACIALGGEANTLYQ